MALRTALGTAQGLRADHLCGPIAAVRHLAELGLTGSAAGTAGTGGTVRA